MAGEGEELRKALLAMFKGKIPLNASWYKCTAVDDKTCTILVDEDDDLKVEGILLGFDKSGSVVIPKKDTDVLVLFADGSRTQGAVILCEETEDMELMGKNYKGIPIVDEIEKNFKELKDYVTGLKAAISKGFDAVGVGSAASGTAGKTAFELDMIDAAINFSDMEGKVQHGSGE